MVVETNIDFIQGDTFSKEFTFLDSNSNAIDISGWIFYFTVKTLPTDLDDDALITHNETVGVGTSGIYTFTVPSSKTNIVVGKYYYDLVYVKPDGSRETVLIGRFNVINRITLRA